jgi:hypothetical protein
LGEQGALREAEHRFRRKSGETIVGLISAGLIEVGGERLVLSIISDITRRKAAEEERERLLGDLRRALNEVQVLSGMLPICAACKKIRDDRGYWEHVEVYLTERTGLDFSHSICPDCTRRLYGEAGEG